MLLFGSKCHFLLKNVSRFCVYFPELFFTQKFLLSVPILHKTRNYFFFFSLFPDIESKQMSEIKIERPLCHLEMKNMLIFIKCFWLYISLGYILDTFHSELQQAVDNIYKKFDSLNNCWTFHTSYFQQ